MPNVLSPRDLVSRPDNMDETVLSSETKPRNIEKALSVLNLNRLYQIYSHMWSLQTGWTVSFYLSCRFNNLHGAAFTAHHLSG